MSISPDTVREALRRVRDPDLDRDVVALGWVKNVAVRGADLTIDLELASPADPLAKRFSDEVQTAARTVPGVGRVDLRLTARVTAGRVDPGGIAPGVKNFIAVGSGKGGVGKSTVATNLAVALAQTGATVGLLDADIYGPSLPTLLGSNARPALAEATGSMQPTRLHGIEAMSIGFLVDPDQPVVWRGPMVHRMIQTFLTQVEWGELDYLVIDMPPGTGDIQLTLGQTIPLTGAVIVSTPQDVALADARKCIQTFKQLNTNLLGIVENMSTFVCPSCSERHDIFGHGGAARLAESLGLPLLGEIPLEPITRIASDEGVPVVIRHPASATAKAFAALAGNVARQVLVRNARAPIPIKLSVSS